PGARVQARRARSRVPAGAPGRELHRQRPVAHPRPVALPAREELMRTPLPLVALLVTSLAGAAAPGEADARPRRKRARPTAPAPKKDPPARPEAPEPPPAEEAAPDAPDGEATAQPEESAATGSSEQATAPAEAAEPPAGGD